MIFWSFGRAIIVFSLILTLSLVPGEGDDCKGHISVIINQEGINFVKDVLIEKAISSMIPLQLPPIEGMKKIPLLGKVFIVLTNITINSVSFSSSQAEVKERSGLLFLASGAVDEITMKWKYSYRNWLVEITDSGDALVQVGGMELRIFVALTEEEGTIKLTLIDCECSVQNVYINLNGGASWLYQAVADVFEKRIKIAVENAISKKISQGISKLDARLHKLPKRIPVGGVAILNATFVKDPVLSYSSIELAIDGLFTSHASLVDHANFSEKFHYSAFSNTAGKMLQLSLREDVLNSAASAFYNTGHMHWTITSLEDDSAAWGGVYPDLALLYPSSDMVFNLSVASSPVLNVSSSSFDAVIALSMVINVVADEQALPVARISLVAIEGLSPWISGNILRGSLEMRSFAASSEWSRVGDPNPQELEMIMSRILKESVLPYVNGHLMEGIALPVPRGFAIREAQIGHSDSEVVVFCDVAEVLSYAM